MDGVSDALEHIYGVANQLEQYRQMMVSFEKAKFETILPQPADSPLEFVGKLKKFDNFIDRINEQEDEDDTPKEG